MMTTTTTATGTLHPVKIGIAIRWHLTLLPVVQDIPAVPKMATATLEIDVYIYTHTHTHTHIHMQTHHRSHCIALACTIRELYK